MVKSISHFIQQQEVSFLGTHLIFNTHIPRKLYTKFGTFVRFVTIQLKFRIKLLDY